MTKEQRQRVIDRRAHSCARTMAWHKVAKAIVDSKWKTLTRYARERLRVSQPSLSLYLTGARETPPEVADKVQEDFGLGDRVWTRPPRRSAA